MRIRVAKAAEDNTIARIIRLVEEAQEARAPTERFIDRFSRWYMPMIVALALLVAVVPPLGFGEPWETWVYRALALLLIGCPCALVISVPARGGYGLPTLFFLIQLSGIAVERSQLGRVLGLGRGWRGWLFTALVLLPPALLLFHPPFLERVVLPFLKLHF